MSLNEVHYLSHPDAVISYKKRRVLITCEHLVTCRQSKQLVFINRSMSSSALPTLSWTNNTEPNPSNNLDTKSILNSGGFLLVSESKQWMKKADSLLKYLQQASFTSWLTWLFPITYFVQIKISIINGRDLLAIFPKTELKYFDQDLNIKNAHKWIKVTRGTEAIQLFSTIAIKLNFKRKLKWNVFIPKWPRNKGLGQI